MPDKVRMMGHVTHMANRRNEYGYKYLDERDHSPDPGIKVRIIFLLNKYIGRVWAEFIWLIRCIPRIFFFAGGVGDPMATYNLIFKDYVIKIMS
jgi:hypothetical protein